MAKHPCKLCDPDNTDRETQRSLDRPVLLIGYLNEANLGLGYLTSVLRQRGYRVEIVDFELEPEQILEIVKLHQPLLIGFSLIFQFYIERFQALALFLRESGVECHFTIGGHFPSLSYQQTLEFIPELDSVVRFEGEDTLVELVDQLEAGRDWRHIKGIAFRRHQEVVANPLRPLIEDLDRLPYPERQVDPELVLGHPIVSILASRGCARTCSFCSIHMFYRSAPGKVVRTRKPAEVVREMRHLYDTRGATIFLFQDDDFPLFGLVWQRWAREFVKELHASGLVDRILWKISCRADAVDEPLFAEMREAGLYFVYMGLESGTEEGLRTLHKQITVEQNLKAVVSLKKLDLAFQFGFMLFEPSSTFESIRENLEFLHAIVDDGSVAVAFCRMIPYDGTPIKDELVRTGRLTGDISHPGYNFLDPRLDRFYYALTQVIDLRGWVHGYESLSPKINIAWSEIFVLERLFPALSDMAEYKRRLRSLTRASNDVLFSVVEETARAFSDNVHNRWTRDLLNVECKRFLDNLLEMRNEFMLRHQAELLRSLGISTSATVNTDLSAAAATGVSP
jgi:radical SAM superfamily enzyme YgiQ (UPF0313 family)